MKLYYGPPEGYIDYKDEYYDQYVLVVDTYINNSIADGGQVREMLLSDALMFCTGFFIGLSYNGDADYANVIICAKNNELLNDDFHRVVDTDIIKSVSEIIKTYIQDQTNLLEEGCKDLCEYM